MSFLDDAKKLSEDTKKKLLGKLVQKKRRTTGLITCLDCSKGISSEAPHCPHCGKPQKGVADADRHKKRSNTQGLGCLIILASLLLMALSPILGELTFVIGFVILIVGLCL